MTGEASSAPATAGARPEGFLGLLRFVVLVVLVGLLVFVAWSTVAVLRRAPVDGAAVEAELLGGPLPFGLVLSEAVRTAGGNRVLTFTRPVPEGATAEATPSEPIEVVVIDYASSGEVAGQFQKTFGDLGMQMAAWEKDPSKPWHGTLRLADIGWGPWTARLKIERSFLAGGGWEDVAQVDLSRPGKPRVLFVRWPREVEASEPQVLRILAALRIEPAEPEGDGPAR